MLAKSLRTPSWPQQPKLPNKSPTFHFCIQFPRRSSSGEQNHSPYLISSQLSPSISTPPSSLNYNTSSQDSRFWRYQTHVTTMAPENGNTTKRGLSELIRSFKAKREERKREEAARNTLAADQYWECLNMTGGTARRGNAASGYYSGREEGKGGQKTSSGETGGGEK